MISKEPLTSCATQAGTTPHLSWPRFDSASAGSCSPSTARRSTPAVAKAMSTTWPLTKTAPPRRRRHFRGSFTVAGSLQSVSYRCPCTSYAESCTRHRQAGATPGYSYWENTDSERVPSGVTETGKLCVIWTKFPSFWGKGSKGGTGENLWGAPAPLLQRAPSLALPLPTWHALYGCIVTKCLPVSFITRSLSIVIRPDADCVF